MTTNTDNTPLDSLNSVTTLVVWHAPDCMKSPSI